MINGAVAKLLSDMSVLLELEGENPFRVRAYQKAVQMVEAHSQDLAKLSREDLLAIPGIGQGIADKIQEFARTGRVQEFDDLHKKYPAGVLGLLHVPGLGPKRVKFLYKEAGIASPAELKQAAAQGKLRGMKGFGQKLEENILKGVHMAQEENRRMLLWQARALMRDLLQTLSAVPGVERLEPAGSLRRGKETVGDLDILCASKRPDAVIDAFVKSGWVRRVLGAGDKKASVLLAEDVQCDLRVVDPACFGAALQYFTGSKEHNVVLRERAQRLGYTINEYGVFRLSDKKQKSLWPAGVKRMFTKS